MSIKELLGFKRPSYYELFSGLSDPEYLSLMVRSVTVPKYRGVMLPGFPEEVIQRQFTGSTGPDTLREGYRFYQYVKEYCRSLGNPIRYETTILDFGCGWGRITRFFFKDISCGGVLGVDVDPEMVAFCVDEMRCGSYRVIGAHPPMGFEDGSIDAIFAYSVFSHLAERTALKWIEEFSRVLSPGGVLVATTQGRFFLDYCESLQGKDHEFGWHQALSRSFIPIQAARDSYDRGMFLYSPTGGGGVRDESFYGEAVIPKAYIEREFARYLSLRDFVHDPKKLPQALFVMQK